MKTPHLLRTRNLTIIAVLFTLSSTPGLPLRELSENRANITGKLDSLDLLKQDLKRSGSPISEIELLQSSLRDSLRNIRNQIQSTSEIAPLQSGEKKTHRFIQPPSNLFDWIIVIVGVIAFFSGLLLIIGISRSFTSMRRKKMPDNAGPPPPSPPPETLPHLQAETPRIILSQKEPEQTYKPADLRSDPGVTTRPADRPEPSPETEPKSRTSIPEESQTVEPMENRQGTKENSLEKQVIIAAESGLDPVTISRRFHISVDHVALLLKMSASRK